jgi:predicted phosphodiesterase
MRLAILSDIHSNLEALRATLAAMAARSVDRLVCLGDIVGYNTSADECVALLREFGPVCVAGNHDRATTGQITTEGFSHTAARAIAWTRARISADSLRFMAGLPLKASVNDQLVMVHGALHPDVCCELVRLDTNERRQLSFEALRAHSSGARICAFGHTHHLGVFELREGVIRSLTEDEIVLRDDAYYLINPGTVGQPRTADLRATYLILDTACRVVTAHHVDYAAEVAFAKTRKAGLSPRSSYVPAVIRNPLKRGVRACGAYDFLKRTGW